MNDMEGLTEEEHRQLHMMELANWLQFIRGGDSGMFESSYGPSVGIQRWVARHVADIIACLGESGWIDVPALKKKYPVISGVAPMIVAILETELARPESSAPGRMWN